MRLPNGNYQTEAGSTLTISGTHGGIFEVDFNWLDEGGCDSCEPEPYDSDGYLVWHCNICGGGHAAWKNICAEIVSESPLVDDFRAIKARMPKFSDGFGLGK